jgi:hypothetical protein
LLPLIVHSHPHNRSFRDNGPIAASAFQKADQISDEGWQMLARLGAPFKL